MANNELSGPVVLSGLINEIKKYLEIKNQIFLIDFLFLPKTIGSIAYIHKNISNLKKKCFFWIYNYLCRNKKKKFKLVLSPNENTVADNIARQALNKIAHNNWETRSFLEEVVMRDNGALQKSTYLFVQFVDQSGEYKEYHTSLDNLDLLI